MKSFLDTVLLIALPASGKSEVRRYLMHEERDRRVEVFHLSDTVQLDDYPYVEFMRDSDDALAELGQEPRFFEGAHGRFLHGGDWGVLLRMVNDDWEVMVDPARPTPAADARLIFDRIDRHRLELGLPAPYAPLGDALRDQLADKMQAKAAWVVHELFSKRPATIEDKTLVIEFARGGPHDATLPLERPHGYRWNLSNLRPEILEKASALYIWVSPEESRRKNAARAPKPGETDTVIFHAAPETVMLNDYGCDDIDWLMANAARPDTIEIPAHGRTFVLPIGRFDNRVDKTTFVREAPEAWDPELREALHQGLTEALGSLWRAHSALRS